MMSALVLKGVQLGPLLLINQPQYLSATFVSMIITNIVMVFVAIGIAKAFAKILSVPYSILGSRYNHACYHRLLRHKHEHYGR